MVDPLASRTRAERETPSELGIREVMRPSRQELQGSVSSQMRTTSLTLGEREALEAEH